MWGIIFLLRVADYLTYCRNEKVPIDFFGWSLYKGDLDEVIGYPAKIRKLLDDYGFKDTELHVAEWNYTNRLFGFYGKNAEESPEGCYGYDAAAFAAAVLIGWQDTPLTMANYYTAGMIMGLFDQYAVPKKNYYGFLAFGEVSKYNRRVVAISSYSDVKILAGLSQQGEGAVLINTTGLEVLCVNNDLNLVPIEFKSETDGIVLEKKSGSSIFLVKGIKYTI